MKSIGDNDVTQDVAVDEQFLRMLTGYWLSKCLGVVARLGVADLMQHAPRTCDELAAETGADPQALYRVLRGLASEGVFAESAPGEFELTPLAERLLSNSPSSMRNAAVKYASESFEAWSLLENTVRTGTPGFEHAFGCGCFDYFQDRPETAAVFDHAMGELGRTMYSNAAILDAYDFDTDQTIVDVGGGGGSFLNDILDAAPASRGVLFDQPHVIEAARQRLDGTDLLSRCECVGGDFFKSVIAGGDLYLLKRIIHDWSDHRSIQILMNCRRAMSNDGRLLILETVLPENGGRHFGKLLDLHMMVVTGGRERTAQQYDQLLQAAGFRLARLIPTACLISLVEAEPATSG